jgi:TetR/AcrR family transcriptional regulator
MKKSTAEQILDAAERHFAERGFSAASLGEIADDVGIRTPSLYKHFPSKQALYHAVCKRLLDPYFEMLTTLLVPPKDEKQALRNLDTVVRFYYRTPNLARLVQYAALAGGEEIDQLIREWFDPFFRRAAQLTLATPALRGSDPRQFLYLVMAFHNMMSGYVTMASLHERVLGHDPLGEEACESHLAFLKQLAKVLWKVPRPRGRRK